MSSENSLIVIIKVKTTIPGVISVIYSNKKTGKFKSATTKIPQTDNTVYIVRLRASTTYHYQVILTTPCGDTYCSDYNCFTTGSLPEKITQSLNFPKIM